MLELCPNCGASVLFTSTICPSCHLDRLNPDPEQLERLRAKLQEQPSPQHPQRQKTSPGREYTGAQKLGIIIFVLFCGVPALEMNGFGFGLHFSGQAAFVCAAIGGAVGGILLCPKALLAGLGGGMVAGVSGLLAVYLYTRHRNEVWNIELILVQGLGSLPGLGIGWIIKQILPKE